MTRTRYSHQITTLVPTKFQQEAWECAKATNEDVQLDEWRETMMKVTYFSVWDLILQYEMLVMTFVRAHHENNFKLYVESLEALVPWFFFP